MSRIYEFLRRKFVAVFPRVIVFIGCSFIMGVLLAGLNSVMCFVSITTSDGYVGALVAPVTGDDNDYVMKLANISLSSEDAVDWDIDANGFAKMYIERAFPITITADGETTEHLTVGLSVKDALNKLGYNVGEEDFSEPNLSEIITEDTQNITLHRVTYEAYQFDDVIPYDTQTQYTSLFYRTQSRVLTIQEGVNGHFSGTLQDKLIDGKVVETTLLEEEEYIEPVEEIIKVYKEGEPISPLEAPEGITVENNVPSSYSQVYEMKATGYYSARGKGASGLGLYYGTFAVDPKVIPYGTKVYIVSKDGRFVYGWAIATDTGAFINTNNMHVDLFYETYTESAANAVQQVYVYVP